MLDLYKTVKRLHEEIYKRCEVAKSRLETDGTERNLADAAFILAECSEWLDDSRKTVDKLLTEVGKVAMVRLVTKGDGEPLCGTYATASGKIKQAATVPSYTKDPESYEAMAKDFGVTPDPLQRLHFPAIKKYLTDVSERTGGVLPPQLQKWAKYTEPVLVAKCRPDNTIDADAANIPGLLGEL
jgi:hypothetical protein